MDALKRKIQISEICMDQNRQYKVSLTGPSASESTLQTLSTPDGGSLTLVKTREIRQPMLADSTTKNASLKKLFDTGKDKYMCLDVLDYLKAFDIEIRHKSASSNEFESWGLTQIDFFRLADWLAQLSLSHHTYEIQPCDILPFRPVLAASKRSALEMSRLLLTVGITDDMGHIDNFNNVIYFNDDGIKRLIKMISLILTPYIEKLERWYA